MQDTQALLILEAAYNLSAGSQDTMRDIARAAIRAMPSGPVAVAKLDGDACLGPDSVHFEGADQDYVSRFLAWQEQASVSTRQHACSLTPTAVNFYTTAAMGLSAEFETIARRLLPLCVMANTGDGRGLHIMFASPCVREWFPVQLHYFHELAQYVAVAWRIRNALHADRPVATPRDVLRCAVLAQDRLRIGYRPADKQPLWQALLAGRWSLLDTFMAAGTRYVIAYRNPENGLTLRTVHARERAVLELVLAGNAGKWIALELQLSESTVARTLRTALRRIGAADPAVLVGVQTALFEPLEGLIPGVDLAVARLAPAPASAGLSDAERAIIMGILAGQRIASIARDRGTSPRTVSNQLASVYRKLGVSSRRELVALLT
jgi:DNA-binding CsgD family transcriptional regulator